MALTLEAEQRIIDVGLDAFYVKHKKIWEAAAKQTYNFIKTNFPHGAKIRRDDVAKALKPILEVNEDLRDELDSHKLRGKFWVSDFADLIIDRTWDDLA